MNEQINLFNIPNYSIDTSKFSNFLHDKIVQEFEKNICEYVGAKYACTINSATNAIFLIFLNKNININIPSLIPPVVPNAIITSGNKINFVDDIEWVGDSYILHDFGDYKIIDSAQKLEKNQFIDEANPNDLMFFSFYPTKPVGSCDGGIIVSNDINKINYFREASLNGMSYSEHNWEREIKFPGYKMYMNSIQAFIANENLKKLDYKKSKLETIRNYYNENLKLSNKSEHLYTINGIKNREKLILDFKNNNIVTGIHYHALHLNSVYKKYTINKDYNLPLSTKQGESTISIPYHENLTIENMDKIIKILKKHDI